MKQGYIYSLNEPDTNVPRYIGWTSNLENRYTRHYCAVENTHKGCWIKKLKKNNQKPILEILDIIPITQSCFWEQHYISLYRSWGFKLVNSTLGGEGSIGYYMPKWVTQKSVNTKKEKGIYLIAAQKTLLKNKESGAFKRVSERMKINNPARNLLSKPILQYSKDGKFIKEWASASVIETELGLFRENIGRVCKKEGLTYDGFRWIFKEGEIKQDIGALPNPYIVIQFDLNDNFIKEWESPKVAALSLGIGKGNIISVCNRIDPTYKGFKWKYKKDV